MKAVAALMTATAISCAAAQGFTWQGTAGGPCTLTASFPTSANCPAPDDDRRKCQVGFTLQPDGQQVAGAGTLMDPTLVPVEVGYPTGLGCKTDLHFNVSVWRQSGLVTMAQLTTVNSLGQIDTVTGTDAAAAVTGSYRANATAPMCQYTYTVDGGACFLSDMPAAPPSSAVAGGAGLPAALALGALVAAAAAALQL